MSNFPAPNANDIVTYGAADDFRDQWMTDQNRSMRTRAMPLLQECRDGIAALDFAGINWGVQSASLADLAPTLEFSKGAGNYHAAIRDSDGAVLGVNGNRHEIIQNDALALLGDAIIEQRPEFRYVSGGSLRGGQTTFLILESENTIEFGPDDKGARSMLLVNDFGGTFPLFVKDSIHRFSCSNQFQLRSVKQRLVSVRHTMQSGWQITAARTALQAAVRSYDALDKELYRLMNTEVALHDVQEQLMGGTRPTVVHGDEDQAKQERARNRFDRDWEKLMLEYTADWNVDHMGTAFGVVMAAQGVDEHSSRVKNGQRQAQRVGRVINGNWPLMARALQATA